MAEESGARATEREMSFFSNAYERGGHRRWSINRAMRNRLTGGSGGDHPACIGEQVHFRVRRAART